MRPTNASWALSMFGVMSLRLSPFWACALAHLRAASAMSFSALWFLRPASVFRSRVLALLPMVSFAEAILSARLTCASDELTAKP